MNIRGQYFINSDTKLERRLMGITNLAYCHIMIYNDPKCLYGNEYYRSCDVKWPRTTPVTCTDVYLNALQLQKSSSAPLILYVCSVKC